jgi:hypothetical protein
MLTDRQIRKLARCYTDKRLVKDCKVIETEDDAWWSNGFIAVWGEKPPDGGNERKTLPADALSSQFTVYTDREVYPVEIAPAAFDGRAIRALRFSDGNGTCVWVQGGFVSAILKRCRKRKVKPRYFALGDKFPVGCDAASPDGLCRGCGVGLQGLGDSGQWEGIAWTIYNLPDTWMLNTRTDGKRADGILPRHPMVHLLRSAVLEAGDAVLACHSCISGARFQWS